VTCFYVGFSRSRVSHLPWFFLSGEKNDKITDPYLGAVRRIYVTNKILEQEWKPNPVEQSAKPKNSKAGKTSFPQAKKWTNSNWAWSWFLEFALPLFILEFSSLVTCCQFLHSIRILIWHCYSFLISLRGHVRPAQTKQHKNHNY